MNTKVVTTEKKLMEALARLISLDPREQIKWLDESDVPDGFENLEYMNQMGFESDLKVDDEWYSGGFVIAPAFMIAVMGYDDSSDSSTRKVLDMVYFEETMDFAEDMLLELCKTCFVPKSMIHLFVYKRHEGYIEIPFELGYYFEETLEELPEFTDLKDAPTEGPKRVYLDDCLVMNLYEDSENNRLDFIEVPDLWDMEYIECPCCGERCEKIISAKNVWGALQIAISMVYELGFNCDMTIRNSWYEYKIEVDEQAMGEDVDLDWDEQPWDIPFEVLRKNTKIYPSRRF